MAARQRVGAAPRAPGLGGQLLAAISGSSGGGNGGAARPAQEEGAHRRGHTQSREGGVNNAQPPRPEVDRHASAAVSIAVGIRVRPLSDDEAAAGETEAWVYEQHQGRLAEAGGIVPTLSGRKGEHVFNFVLPPEVETAEVYASLGEPIVQSALSGINACLFAYGQTGSGKTHTLIGSGREPGTILLAVRDVFAAIEAARDDEYLLRCSMLEIYNEELHDLLDPDTSGGLKVVDGAAAGPYVKGLTEEVVTRPARVLELLALGEANRHVGSTSMNARSSRSHTLFRLIIESRRVEGTDSRPGMSQLALSIQGATGAAARANGLLTHVGDASYPPASLAAGDSSTIVRVASLHLVDLAGSERAAKSLAEGQALREASNINVSLLTLGVVVYKLTTGESHVPYRDSKLTRLLATSLGGNSRTAIVVCMSPTTSNMLETRQSLTFAARAMRVVNRARVNEVASAGALLLDQYRREVASLRSSLESMRYSQAQRFASPLDGELVTLPELVEQQRAALETRIRGLEESLRTATSSAAGASALVMELLQLVYVSVHAAGHLRSASSIVAALGEVADGTLLPTAAVRNILADAPKFKARVVKLLRLGALRMFEASPLARELIAEDAFSPTLRLSDAISENGDARVQRGAGMLSVSSLRSPGPMRHISLDRSPDAASAAEAARSPASRFTDDHVDYFSPASFARQMHALLAIRDTAANEARELGDALALKAAEAHSWRKRAEAAETRVGAAQSSAMLASEDAAAEMATILGLRAENSRLSAEMAEVRASETIALREAAAADARAATAVTWSAESTAGWERALDEASEARTGSDAAARAAELRAREAEALKSIAERELASMREVVATGEAAGRRDREAAAEAREARAIAEAEAVKLRREVREAEVRTQAANASFEQAAVARVGVSASYNALQTTHAAVLQDRDAALELAETAERDLSLARRQLASRDVDLAAVGSGREVAERDLLLTRHVASSSELKAKDMEGRLAGMREEVSLLRAGLSDKEAALASVTTKLEGKRAQVAELSAMLDDARARVGAAASANDEQHRLYLAAEGESRSLRTQLDSVRNEMADRLDSLGAQVQEMLLQLNASETNASEGRAREDEGRRLLKEAEERTVTVSARLRDVTSRAATDGAMAAASAERQARACDVLKEEASAASARAGFVAAELERVRAEADELAVEMAQERVRVRFLGERVEELTAARVAAQADVAAARARLAELEGSVRGTASAAEERHRSEERAAAEAIAALRLALAQANASADMEAARAGAAEAQLETMRQTVEKVTAARVAEAARAGTAEAQLASASAQLNAAGIASRASGDALQSLRSEASRQAERLLEAEALERAYAELSGRSRVLEEDVAEARRAAKAATAREEAARVEGERLRVLHSEAVVSSHEATHKVALLTVSLADALANRDAATTSRASTESEMRAAREEAGRQRSGAEALLTARNRLIESLEAAKSSAATERSQLLDELSRQRSGAESLLTERTRLVEALDAVKSAAAAEKLQLTDELNRQRSGAESLLAERKRLMESLDATKSAAAYERSQLLEESSASSNRAREKAAAEAKAVDALREALLEVESACRSRDKAAEAARSAEAEREAEKARASSAGSARAAALAQAQAAEMERTAALARAKAAEAERDATARAAVEGAKASAIEVQEALASQRFSSSTFSSFEARLAAAREALGQEQSNRIAAEVASRRAAAESDAAAAGLAAQVRELRDRLAGAEERVAEATAAGVAGVAALRGELLSALEDAHRAKDGLAAGRSHMAVLEECAGSARADAAVAISEADSARARSARLQRELALASAEAARAKADVAALRDELRRAVEDTLQGGPSLLGAGRKVLRPLPSSPTLGGEPDSPVGVPVPLC
jgi:centromeric protein E